MVSMSVCLRGMCNVHFVAFSSLKDPLCPCQALLLILRTFAWISCSNVTILLKTVDKEEKKAQQLDACLEDIPHL